MIGEPERVVLDTNVFVAAGFNRDSSSARLLEAVRTERVRMVWNDATRGEIERILQQIPPLRGTDISELFAVQNRFPGQTDEKQFADVRDRDDRKFAALASAAEAVLITNDDHLLSVRGREDLTVVTPAEFWSRGGG